MFEQTLERAAEIGLDVVRLTAWYDVDDASALRRLVIELLGDDDAGDGWRGGDAPFTREFLRELLTGGLAERLGLAGLLGKTSR